MHYQSASAVRKDRPEVERREVSAELVTELQKLCSKFERSEIFDALALLGQED